MSLTLDDSKNLAQLADDSSRLAGIVGDVLDLLRTAGQGGIVDIATHNNNPDAHGIVIDNHNADPGAHPGLNTGGGLPLLSLMAVPSSLVQEGYLSVTRDNGILSGDPASTDYPAFQAAYEQLAARKDQKDTAIVSMADYATEMTTNGGVCGRFAIDTTAKTFRLPCATGLYWAAVMSGQNAGDYLLDQIVNIQSPENAYLFTTSGSPTRGPWEEVNRKNSTALMETASNGFDLVYGRFNASKVTRTGDRVRPHSWALDYQMKMYGTVSDAGSIQLAQLVQAMSDVDARIEATVSYSTAETWTGGYWIDGKKIYRKVVDCGALPNAATKNVPHGIVNPYMFIRCRGMFRQAENYTTGREFENQNVTLGYNSTNLVITTTIDYSPNVGFVVVEYTCTDR